MIWVAVLAVAAIAGQVVGIGAGGVREAVLGWLVPMLCAATAGFLGGVWPSFAFAVVVGVLGPELSIRFGIDPTDGTINFLLIPWLIVPILVGCAALGMLARLGRTAWTERRSSATFR